MVLKHEGLEGTWCIYRHFGAVGWQPTALKSNHGLETRGFGGNLMHFGAVGWQAKKATMHFGAVGWQPTALKSNHGLETRGFGGNLRHFGAVGWQPTALKSNHGGLEILEFEGTWVKAKATMEGLKYFLRELEAFWGCRLATYST